MAARSDEGVDRLLEGSEIIDLDFLSGDTDFKRAELIEFDKERFGKGAPQDISDYDPMQLGQLYKNVVLSYVKKQPFEELDAGIPPGLAPVRSLEKIEVPSETDPKTTHYIAKLTDKDGNSKYSCSCKSYSPVAMFPRNPNECKHIKALKQNQ